MAGRTLGQVTEASLTRTEQKERTRRAILDASLALSAESTLAALSLRAVAKEVGVVPTAFYRHFGSVDEVGLALVDESFASLRALLRELRTGAPGYADLIDSSIQVLVEHVTTHRELFRFLVRERVAGPPRVRAAIGHEIALTTRELATDLARLPGTEGFATDDLRLLADLIVSFVGTTAERLVSEPEAAKRIAAGARVQLRMLMVGAVNWRSR
ncbi:TetR family transcriptional regulator [Nocardioides gansuensis]|uniref:TetR family transcriptional regulator n=1 Tax=Nocardioides gansuensis TaxID=2138300 RepID=A0A2T8FC92_9ACTN|nr:TetR family transcriptional regulator [Nocardioides gansuensis]